MRLLMLMSGLVFLHVLAFGAENGLRILVVNDDGIDAPGIAVLAGELKKQHDVVVVAPDRNQSGSGHTFSTNTFSTNWVKRLTPRFRDGRFFGYAVDDTPAGSTIVGIELLGKTNRFDLVVSGINRGENVAWVKFCSGTEAAARMARMMGVPSLAVSQVGSGTNYSYAVGAEFVRRFVEQIHPEKWKEPAYWSINIPADTSKIKGVRLVPSSFPVLSDGLDVQSRREDDGSLIINLNVKKEQALAVSAATPEAALLDSGYITVSPQRIDTVYGPAFESLAARYEEFERLFKAPLSSIQQQPIAPPDS
ncbi:MAG: 5'/3'-nucleotidase SurE [Verrucomicrobiia bacterium]